MEGLKSKLGLLPFETSVFETQGDPGDGSPGEA
jgi:hypothetical protein